MATADQLEPKLLTDALRNAGVIDGQSVVDIAKRQVGTGQMGACYALTLTYDAEAPSAPDRLVAKLPSSDAGSQAWAAATGAYAREVNFYKDVAASLPVRTPRCYAAEVDEAGSDFLLLLEDMSPAAECGQLEGCDADRAALALEQAAALHAGSWRDPRLQAMGWLHEGLGHWRRVAASAEPVSVAFVDRYSAGLDDVAIDVALRLGAGIADRWVQTLTEPRCLWHGDFRLDNLMFEARGGEVPVAVVDWQSVTLAPGPIDTSYFIGAGLTRESRRVEELDLVRSYHQALAAGGVDDYDWDQCWLEYRMNTVEGFVMTMITSMAVQQTERGDEMFLTMADRHASHIADHDSLKLIEVGASL